jgi:4-amino-4-deoxy-L-arabinose transferase-like glycosyltransferase
MIPRRLLCAQNRWVFLLILNLILNLVFCFVLFPRLAGGTTGLDPDGYGGVGRALYETGRFESITQAPLYPAFVALASLLVGGYQLWVVQTAQCVLASLTCALLYAVFRRLLEEPVAWWAGLACAIYPMSLWYTPRLWTETFLAFILVGLTLSLVSLLQNPTAPRALLCGAMASVAALSKGIALVFVLLIPLVLLLRFRGRAWRRILPFILAAVALLAPWVWHNWTLTGEFLPVHANGGYNFYLGNGFARHWLQAPLSYAELKAYTMQDAEGVYASLGIVAPVDPLAVDRILMHAALGDVVARPVLAPQKLIVQSLTFWYLAADVPKSILTGVLQFPVVLMALPGIVRTLRCRSWALTLLVPIAGIMGVSVLVLAFARLSATIMPYVIGLVAYGLWPIIARSRRTS